MHIILLMVRARNSVNAEDIQVHCSSLPSNIYGMNSTQGGILCCCFFTLSIIRILLRRRVSKPLQDYFRIDVYHFQSSFVIVPFSFFYTSSISFVFIRLVPFIDWVNYAKDIVFTPVILEEIQPAQIVQRSPIQDLPTIQWCRCRFSRLPSPQIQ